MTQLSLYFGMLMMTANFSSTAQYAPSPTPAAYYELTVEEQKFVAMVNDERASRGLRRLVVDPVLVDASRSHSSEMAELDYFDHYSPTPGLRTAMERYLLARHAQPSYAYLGENLFYCSITDVKRGHNKLMNSPGHRANIVNPKFERIGVGVYKAPDGQFWVTQMFLAEKD